jgi:addiction module HigA family antidote
MRAAELGYTLKAPTNRIMEILNGRRAVTGNTALRPGHFFGTSPEFRMNLQKLQELRLAENKSRKAIKDLPTLREKPDRFTASADVKNNGGYRRGANLADPGSPNLP